MNLSLIFNNYSRAMPAPPLGELEGILMPIVADPMTISKKGGIII